MTIYNHVITTLNIVINVIHAIVQFVIKNGDRQPEHIGNTDHTIILLHNGRQHTMEQLLNPERVVIIERKLRYPEGEITREYCYYNLALMLILEMPYEENTASVYIRELEQG